jgi:membrane protein YdbS with pleckstrin-like domain
MSTTKSNSGTGLSLSAVLFIVFLVLKLTNNIDWSWWWVTSPLWIPLAFGLALVGIVFLVIVIALIFGVSVEDIKSKIKIKK